jgi:DNA-directed RNA polymerase subunit beta'
MHVRDGEWVERGAPILTLSYQKLVTGDIVQGIPKIEQFFEAPTTRDGEPLANNLQARARRSFDRLRRSGSAPKAVKGSIEDIQQALVEGILKVYLSQGVRIADKHLEIVVRQMTSKGHITDAGDTGLFRGEQVDLGRIERLNLATYGQRANYEPAVLGITKAALDSESFISAASFQETTRVLSRDTIIGKTDFLRGLKERVVLGDLIQAGTGLDDNINYGLLFGVDDVE